MGRPWISTLSQVNMRNGLKFLFLKIERETGIKNKASKNGEVRNLHKSRRNHKCFRNTFLFHGLKKKKDRLSGSYSESKTNQRVINT